MRIHLKTYTRAPNKGLQQNQPKRSSQKTDQDIYQSNVDIINSINNEISLLLQKGRLKTEAEGLFVAAKSHVLMITWLKTMLEICHVDYANQSRKAL